MVYVMFLSKDKVLIKFGLVYVFLARKGLGCPSERKFLSKEKGFSQIWIILEMVQVASVKEKSMSQIGLTWGNRKIWLLDNVPLNVNRE